MKKPRFERIVWACAVLTGAAGLAGCSTAGRAASDLGLAGAGGVVGYQVSGKKIGGAVVGATVGYLASKVAQSEVSRGQTEAEKRGYDRALNQAVKQQYWIIQEQQHSRETQDESPARLVSVVVPETKINGVVQNAHVEYLRVQ